MPPTHATCVIAPTMFLVILVILLQVVELPLPFQNSYCIMYYMSVYIIVYNLHVQFSLGNLIFFITKHHISATKCFIITQGVVPNVPSMFHEAPSVQSGGVWSDVF